MLPLLPLSQGQLNLLETCPRKFQYIFNDALSVPAEPDQKSSAAWGSQFHLLMQQQALGLPIEVMAPADEEMMGTVEALKKADPTLFAPCADEAIRLSESQRTLEFNGYLLTVIYDLLLLSDQQGQVLDWKTYLKPPKKIWLEKDWQTRLYLYVLAETTALEPEQISIIYWFVRCRDAQTDELKPEFYRFNYSASRHQQARQDLLLLTDQLTELRQLMADFPQVSVTKGICERCPFALRCQRLEISDRQMGVGAALRGQWVTDLDSIEEIVF